MPKVLIDNPLTRASFTCPFCLGPKNQGLVACWPCFRERFKDGDHEAEQAEEIVSEFETFLESQGARS